MDCCDLQVGMSDWSGILLAASPHQVDRINQNIRNVIKSALGFLAYEYNRRDSWSWLLAANWSEDTLPYTQQDIDRTREASRDAQCEAREHIKGAWEALGNGDAGSVIRESIDGWNSLRESEKFEKEAVHMENSNIDHYDNER